MVGRGAFINLYAAAISGRMEFIMIIYPAIDIKGGSCVRLVQGRLDEDTVYGTNPAEVAKEWEEAGASYIHVVDLDGAFAGKSVNSKCIKEISNAVSVPIQLGGGVRNIAGIENSFFSGVQRVILGTAAVNNPDFVRSAAMLYHGRIVVGIDAKDGYAAIEGWAKVSNLKAVEFAKEMADIGIETIIYTDIATDGMLSGPNLAAMEEMVRAVPNIDVIASGGVSGIEDIIALKSTGVQGVITGKALYTKRLNLAQAIKVAMED